MTCLGPNRFYCSKEKQILNDFIEVGFLVFIEMNQLNDTTVELPLQFYHCFYPVFKVEGESVFNHILSSVKKYSNSF